MKKKVPAWSGCVCSVLALVGYCLPVVKISGDSLFRVYYDFGGDSRSMTWLLVLILGISALAALMNARWLVTVCGLCLGWVLGLSLAGMIYVIGLPCLLVHLSVGGWCCIAGALGMLLCPALTPLDRWLQDSALKHA